MYSSDQIDFSFVYHNTVTTGSDATELVPTVGDLHETGVSDLYLVQSKTPPTALPDTQQPADYGRLFFYKSHMIINYSVQFRAKIQNGVIYSTALHIVCSIR